MDNPDITTSQTVILKKNKNCCQICPSYNYSFKINNLENFEVRENSSSFWSFFCCCEKRNLKFEVTYQGYKYSAERDCIQFCKNNKMIVKKEQQDLGSIEYCKIPIQAAQDKAFLKINNTQQTLFYIAKHPNDINQYLRNCFYHPERIQYKIFGNEVNGGQVNGGQANGGQVNGGQANGGQVNGGQANGGQANGGQANGRQENIGQILKKKAGCCSRINEFTIELSIHDKDLRILLIFATLLLNYEEYEKIIPSC